MKREKIKYFVLILFFFVSIVMYSHGKIKEPPFPKPNGPGPIPQLPIDGGVTFLLIAGTFLGAYTLKKK